MDKRGNVWWIGGHRGTGKSWEAERIAESLKKRIVVYDWTDNQGTYGHITTIEIADLEHRLNKTAKVKIIDRDFAAFVEKCHSLRNTTIVVDDATSMFEGTIPQRLKELLYTVKNWRLEVIFQFHTIVDTPPAFLKACNMYIIKATDDSFPLKNTAPHRQIIEPLILDCIAENEKYPSGQKFATRLFDTQEGEIFEKIQNVPFKKSYTEFSTVRDYLDFKSGKKNTLNKQIKL